MRIERWTLPEHALLRRYQLEGAYTDCYITEIAGEVTREQYVQAFYSTLPFRLERLILKWAVSKPSTDADVAQLASGAATAFAAWDVEARSESQLLLVDFRGSTRSWLMVEALPSGAGTRLYFGSAVVPAKTGGGGRAERGFLYTVLLGFHKLYSVTLLHAARRSLTRMQRLNET
jgi:hypothetical protein